MKKRKSLTDRIRNEKRKFFDRFDKDSVSYFKVYQSFCNMKIIQNLPIEEETLNQYYSYVRKNFAKKI